MAEEVQKRRSPWVYVGVGCGLALVLLCGGGLVVVLGLLKMGNDWKEEMSDPTRRENKARKEAMATLGGIPEGYSAAFSLGVPMLFDTVLFVDAPLLSDGGVPEFTRIFQFVRSIETEQNADMRAFFDRADGGSFENDNVQLDSKGEVARGSFMHKGRKVSWVSMKGRLRTQGSLDMDEDGLVTLMLFDCPADGQVRLGTWQMRAPEGGVGELPGTVADQNEMQKLLAPLSPCGK